MKQPLTDQQIHEEFQRRRKRIARLALVTVFLVLLALLPLFMGFTSNRLIPSIAFALILRGQACDFAIPS